MRVLFNIMMLAIPLHLSSIGCFALPLHNSHNFEIRGSPTSVKKFANAIANVVIREKILIGYSFGFVQDASAETLTASTTSIGEGAVLAPSPSGWFGSTVCAVYADKQRFQNVPKLFVDDIHVMTATLPQILQEQSQAPEHATTTSTSSFTKETTILFYRMLGSPRGNLQMLIPPYYFKSSQPSNKFGISLKCVPLPQYEATKKFPTGMVEWDKWNVPNWPQELKLTV
ncbi:hypothetical protein F5890DRAFT_1533515 [Lentinula detonsa]|uniref:Uncharacterized protein n=1 Tax=Lentinula detonsa TaxID=2804962 RepID=A0AA38PU50_9AGAR|nr:hypothetical protein F5890DRAFT_1533515 [Lentinula detonsa]